MLPEKFNKADVSALRDQLQQTIPDPLEIADILRTFLTDRGYGVCSHSALDAASKVGAAGCSFTAIQEELEAVALVM
jgi:hypothetical protein